MTAPVLSPAEQAEVERFGVHDEDVIADLESNFDEEPRCTANRRTGPCGLDATDVAICRSCGEQTCLLCTGHADWARSNMRVVSHTSCGFRGPMCHVVRVEPL